MLGFDVEAAEGCHDEDDILEPVFSILCNLVEFTNLNTNVKMKYEIVSPHEMNLEEGKISLNLPIGAALMGKKVGEIAEVAVPSGTLRLRIDSITTDTAKEERRTSP